MKTYKIAIIDDEENARNALVDLLELYFDRPYELTFAHSVLTGLKLLKFDEPDILLIDIQMEDGTGFELLDLLGSEIDFPVIFTTAHDNYALRAFDHNAIDYLLKPVIEEDLIKALERAIKQIGNEDLGLSARELIQTYNYVKKETIVFNTQKELRKVKIENIAYITAESNFCFVYLMDCERLTVTNTLKEYERLLPTGQFQRSHKSYLVNMDCVVAYVKKDGGYILLENDLQVPLSKRNKQEFIKQMKLG